MQADRRVHASILFQLQEMRLYVPSLPDLPSRPTVGLGGLQVQVRLRASLPRLSVLGLAEVQVRLQVAPDVCAWLLLGRAFLLLQVQAKDMPSWVPLELRALQVHLRRKDLSSQPGLGLQPLQVRLRLRKGLQRRPVLGPSELYLPVHRSSAVQLILILGQRTL